MLACGATYRTAAGYAGCGASTISMLMKRDEAFRAEVARALAQRELIPLANLRHASKRSWRAAAWLLERTVKGTYRRENADDPTDLDRVVESEALAEERAAERVRRMMEEMDEEDDEEEGV